MDEEADVRCLSCTWEGIGAETADDGPSWPVCCPLCGSDDLAWVVLPVESPGAGEIHGGMGAVSAPCKPGR